jgi:hypothetical protein
VDLSLGTRCAAFPSEREQQIIFGRNVIWLTAAAGPSTSCIWVIHSEFAWWSNRVASVNWWSLGNCVAVEEKPNCYILWLHSMSWIELTLVAILERKEATVKPIWRNSPYQQK